MDQRPHEDKGNVPGGFPRLSESESVEYDALTELFLGDAELAPKPASVGARTGRTEPPARPARPVASEGGAAPRAVVGASPESVRVEAVLLGHLPVRASIWVRQYASAVAGGMGRPVGLLRVGPEVSSVELVGPGSGELAAAGGEPAGSLEAALRLAGGLTDRWIVRVDETAEPGLAECGAVDEVTILTGADEAAVVASYRLVKSLAASWDKAFGEDGGPTLGLAIMGASGEQALAASEKLERAAEAFLNRAIRVTARVPKIGVSSAATLYRGNESGGAGELLNLLKGGAEAPLRIVTADWRPSETPAEEMLEAIEFELDGEQGDEAGVEGTELGEAEPDGAGVETGGTPEPAAPAVVTRAVSDVAGKPIERAMGREPLRMASAAGEVIEAEEAEETAAAPSAAMGPAGDAVRAHAGDASGAALLGLTAIESRCPFAGGVELAADGEGRLHLIASERFGGEREAATQLLAASAWARAHLALLLRAEPALSQPTSDDPHEATMHLLTSDARAVRAILDGEVRVHLVTRVELGGRTGWVASELN